MANTGHGHHIPGTIDSGRPNSVARCGGVNLCTRCKNDVLEYAVQNVPSNVEPVDYHLRARMLLIKYIDAKSSGFETIPYEVYTVSFSKTLQNWRALLVTDMMDSRIYELVHDGNKRVTYVNEYEKINHTVISD